MTINKELEALKAYSCTDRCVLSVYLNTNPADPDTLKGAWKIHLKSGLKRIGEYLEASNDEREIKAFEQIKKKVFNEIEENAHDLRKGIVIFATANEDIWSVYYAQVPVKTNFYWENHAMTEQLEYMYKAYPEAGIIMPSFGEVRILDTAMGLVRDDLTFKFDPVSEEWREKKKIDAKGRRAVADSRTAVLEPGYRINANNLFKGMRVTIEQLKKKRGWREFHVAGEAEMAKAFTDSIRDLPASCIHKNLNNSKSNEIIHQIFEK
ncbi:VLRF1 family aeRF1-type release factor [Psychrobacillus sp. NEAU-3TGS]|uniref:VLRF1 family aeRF1-type release factor n=1 Tax=Psychrobacillus sp. NEAU-3TGS TaxID=2995412 RepID=UPI00249942C9|nr:VLRF1 family aeRF1-type release factor [Psychrobacillus sp. NEAU-3TGS]MDI2586822.1 VLRF1 family aeRF1-type release factor [Psychrobacillus sp. NEAU-3TGS]